MLEINRVLKNNNLVPKAYLKKGDSYIITTEDNKKVIIQKHNSDIYKYLKSRNFNYYPEFISYGDYDIIEYIDDIFVPDEQKILDLIKLVSLLHSKTTFYKEMDEDDIKKIYEDIIDDTNYLENYYNNMINNIDSKIYMSPSENLLANNINKIFSAINYSRLEIEKWYKIIKTKNKIRYAVINNDLRIENLLENDKKYIINWDKACFDIPVFDIYNLYKKYAISFDFESLLKTYEHDYPFLEDEKKLFFSLISMPYIIDEKNEYEKCKKIYKLISYLDKTDKLISPYYFNNAKDNKNIKNE